MAAIAITTDEHGPLTIPLASVNILRKAKNGRAIVVFHNGSEITAREEYQKVSDRMISVQIWGSVATEAA